MILNIKSWIFSSTGVLHGFLALLLLSVSLMSVAGGVCNTKKCKHRLEITHVVVGDNMGNILIYGRHIDRKDGEAPRVTLYKAGNEIVETGIISLSGNPPHNQEIDVTLNETLAPGDYKLVVKSGKGKKRYDTWNLTVAAQGNLGHPEYNNVFVVPGDVCKLPEEPIRSPVNGICHAQCPWGTFVINGGFEIWDDEDVDYEIIEQKPTFQPPIWQVSYRIITLGGAFDNTIQVFAVCAQYQYSDE
ncbi:MAG: hypothetical protein HRU20_30230 [Pseudomonadales bacterium]|nr:hypothetical protein [Pseudomonadales bacterium]